jgi:hypothetical protein
MRSKRTGRPREVEPGASSNVYLPFVHRDYIQSLADANYLSFSAAIRLLVEADMRANAGKARVLS